EEIAPAGELAEQVPGGAMGPVVDHISALGLEVDGNPAVLGHGEDEEQLLEVGTVILVMPPGDRQPGLPTAFGLLGRVQVRAGEGYRGRVVVQFVQLDVEFGDGLSGDGQGEGTTVAAEELVQAAADAVIIERGELLGCQSQRRRIAASGPLRYAVEG